MSKIRTTIFAEWLKARRVSEVECLVAGHGGHRARKSICRLSRFHRRICATERLRLPESIFGQMVTGADCETEILTYQSPDMNLIPDGDTLRIVPWYKEPTAQVDLRLRGGAEWRAGDHNPAFDSRSASFSSTKIAAGGRSLRLNLNSSLPQKTSIPTIRCCLRPKRAGRPQAGRLRAPCSIDAVNEFDPIFEDVYDYCEAQDIDIDNLIHHEEGVAQVEMNFNHGDPVALGRPDVPVQAHGASGSVAPRHLRNLHGEAL